MLIVLWTVVLIAAILVEAATCALVAIWFAAGALGALIAAGLGASLAVQLIVFVVMAVVMLIFTRPLLKKLFPNKFIPTNSELDIGKSAIVIEDIDGKAGTGRVRLNGVDWSAVEKNGEVIPKGETVTVVEIRSAKLIVSRMEINIEEK